MQYQLYVLMILVDEKHIYTSKISYHYSTDNYSNEGFKMHACIHTHFTYIHTLHLKQQVTYQFESLVSSSRWVYGTRAGLRLLSLSYKHSYHHSNTSIYHKVKNEKLPITYCQGHSNHTMTKVFIKGKLWQTGSSYLLGKT